MVQPRKKDNGSLICSLYLPFAGRLAVQQQIVRRQQCSIIPSASKQCTSRDSPVTDEENEHLQPKTTNRVTGTALNKWTYWICSNNFFLKLNCISVLCSRRSNGTEDKH